MILTQEADTVILPIVPDIWDIVIQKLAVFEADGSFNQECSKRSCWRNDPHVVTRSIKSDVRVISQRGTKARISIASRFTDQGTTDRIALAQRTETGSVFLRQDDQVGLRVTGTLSCGRLAEGA
jgi:hypothetical protein